MKLILGSSSKWRAQFLREAGFVIETMAPDIDEKAIRRDDPEALVLALAHAKADALMAQIREPSLLITSDQVVVCNGRVLEKPKDELEARSDLACYLDHPAEAVNGVVVTNTQTGKRVEGIDRAKVFYKPTLAGAINAIIAQGDVMSCGGALKAEDPMFTEHMDHIEGDLNSFAGAPIDLIRKLLVEAE